MGTSYIFKGDEGKYNLSSLTGLKTKEDVCTLIETYMTTRQYVHHHNIVNVVKDANNYYYMVVDKNNTSINDLELLGYIKERFNVKEDLNAFNLGIIFPKSLSRGLGSLSLFSEVQSNISVEDLDKMIVGNSSETGMLDESMLEGITPKENTSNESKYYEDTSFDDPKELSISKEDNYVLPTCLYFPRMNTKIPFTRDGIIIGRSKKTAGFVINGNSSVGRNHCRVYLDTQTNRVYIHDYDSVNGTFVNSTRVLSSKDVSLTVGDTVELANELFKVQ